MFIQFWISVNFLFIFVVVISSFSYKPWSQFWFLHFFCVFFFIVSLFWLHISMNFLLNSRQSNSEFIFRFRSQNFLKMPSKCIQGRERCSCIAKGSIMNFKSSLFTPSSWSSVPVLCSLNLLRRCCLVSAI